MATLALHISLLGLTFLSRAILNSLFVSWYPPFIVFISLLSIWCSSVLSSNFISHWNRYSALSIFVYINENHVKHIERTGRLLDQSLYHCISHCPLYHLLMSNLSCCQLWMKTFSRLMQVRASYGFIILIPRSPFRVGRLQQNRLLDASLISKWSNGKWFKTVNRNNNAAISPKRTRFSFLSDVFIWTPDESYCAKTPISAKLVSIMTSIFENPIINHFDHFYTTFKTSLLQFSNIDVRHTFIFLNLLLL